MKATAGSCFANWKLVGLGMSIDFLEVEGFLVPNNFKVGLSTKFAARRIIGNYFASDIWIQRPHSAKACWQTNFPGVDFKTSECVANHLA